MAGQFIMFTAKEGVFSETPIGLHCCSLSLHFHVKSCKLSRFSLEVRNAGRLGVKVPSQCLELIALAASRHFFTVRCQLYSGLVAFITQEQTYACSDRQTDGRAQAIGCLVWPVSSLVLLWPQVPALVKLEKWTLLLAQQTLNVVFWFACMRFELFSFGPTNQKSGFKWDKCCC